MSSIKTIGAISALSALLLGSIPAYTVAAPVKSRDAAHATAAKKKSSGSNSKKKNTSSQQQFRPKAKIKGCKKWTDLPRIQTCQVYSQSMGITIPVDIQLPYTYTGKTIYMFEGMVNAPRQGLILNNAGRLARALAKTNVGFVAPILPTDGSMQTDWNVPTILPSGRPIQYETFYMKELPRYLYRNFGYRTRSKNQLAFGVSMGAAGAASIMLRYPNMFSGGYFLSGFYNFDAFYQRQLIRNISRSSGGIGSTMWSLEEFQTHSPETHVHELTKMNTRFVAGNGLINPNTGEIKPSDINQTLRRATIGAGLEVGTAKCLFHFLKTVRAEAPTALDSGRAVFIHYDSGVHDWPLWRDDMYRAGGLKDILSRNGVKYNP